MLIVTRRKFLKLTTGSLATGLATQLISFEDIANAAISRPLAANTPLLVVVTLSGGNDGVNDLQSYKDSFTRLYNKNYKIIYNGIKIPKKKIYIKKKIKINVSFVGRVELENNPELFLRLAKESFLSGGFYNFHVFGDGSLLRILKKNYSQYAKFHNWKKIDDIYKITNLLVITSKVNNFPYVALEAKSYGVPVLSCSKGDISKIIKNNKDGYLILSHSPNQLLKYLNIMKKRYNSLVKYSLKSRYKFNLEKSCRKFWQSII